MAVPRYDSGAVDPAPLGEPLYFHRSGRTAKNRFLKSPMAENLATWSAKDMAKRGIPTDETIQLYSRWGQGENSWGVIVTGNIDVQADAMGGIGDMVIEPDSPLEGERFERFKALAAAAKASGSLLVGQVNHPGRQLFRKINSETISASDVQHPPALGAEFARPRPATKEDIAEVVSRFVYAAAYLEAAGFDGIELHGAHGYLISQFLSRTTNLRTDEYGTQTPENRLRFLTDLVRAIKARVAPSFLVAVKLNSVEFQDGGVTPDEARAVVTTLEREGLDYVQLSGGTYEEMGLAWTKASTRAREGFFLEFAESIVGAASINKDERKMRVYIAGGLRSTRAMVAALQTMDGIALARPAAAEPRLPDDILRNRVSGALKPVPSVEDFLLGMTLAGAHLRQIGQGFEPLSGADEAAMATFGQDMGAWFQKVAEDGEKMEVVGAVRYSGALKPYGTKA